MNDLFTRLALCILLLASACSTTPDSDSVEARVKPYASDYQ